jgi:hypothetical protein
VDNYFKQLSSKQTMIEISDIKNSFQFLDASINDRIPSTIKLYGFDINKTHAYKIVALHALSGIKQDAGIVDFSDEIVKLSTLTAIGKGLNINHDVLLNEKYKHVIADAAYENNRQEYIVLDEDPEIFRLVNEGYITGVSIQGRPRIFLENCAHCNSGHCDCKLSPEGLVLGLKSEDPLHDGIALAYVVTKEGATYHAKPVRATRPADGRTSVEILLTEKGGCGSITKPFQTTVEIINTELTNKGNLQNFQILDNIYKSSLKTNTSSIIMEENHPACGPTEHWDAVAQTCVPNQVDATQTTTETTLAQTVATEGDKTAATKLSEMVTKLTTEIELMRKEIADNQVKNKHSFAALVEADKELSTKLVKMAEKPTTQSITLTSQEGTTLTPDEIAFLKEYTIKNSPLQSFI